MIVLKLCDKPKLADAQRTVEQYHYLHAKVDPRCSPVAYEILLDTLAIGYLIYGRPESTRLYAGPFTYGSVADVESKRAQYCRWEILNLARVWLNPRVQHGGDLYSAEHLPGYVGRDRVWRSMLASHCIKQSLSTIGYDFLSLKPPVFTDEPYMIRAVLSYCDTRKHKGTIYRVSKFDLARINAQGIETYYTTNVAPLTDAQRAVIHDAALRSPRAIRLRAQRAVYQTELFV